MKTTLLILFIILTSFPSSAQSGTSNYMGTLWEASSPAYDYDCLYQEENQIVTLSLNLVEPVNPDFGDGQVRDVTNVSGFECKVTTTEGITILGWNFPVPAILSWPVFARDRPTTHNSRSTRNRSLRRMDTPGERSRRSSARHRQGPEPRKRVRPSR